LAEAAVQLAVRPDASPRLEAQALLAGCLKRPRSYLFAWPERILSTAQWRAFQALLQRRRDGEPLAYILGEREFWSLRLEVAPSTLIPRPETELLVELALQRGPAGATARVLELGTGSGAIAAALASERPGWGITATDNSHAALALAKRNFARLGLGNVRPLLGDWYAALPRGEHFDLILSNPPYVARDDPHLQQGDLPWEPRDALVAGPDGLDAIRVIGAGAPAHLAPGGWLLLEHGCEQGPAVRSILRDAGLCQVASERDLAGLERVSLGRAPGPDPVSSRAPTFA
jgi:release factor glutamine methyltransferase